MMIIIEILKSKITKYLLTSQFDSGYYTSIIEIIITTSKPLKDARSSK